MDWSYNLGEPALDLAVVSFPQTPPSVLVLGERSIVCLKDTGSLRFMKKLEYNPSCFYAYTARKYFYTKILGTPNVVTSLYYYCTSTL